MSECKGYINSIETMGLVDGPGIRIVFFLQGCPLRCLFCHNPETWKENANFVMTPNEIVQVVLKYKNYFTNQGGVTFSGGDPLMQSDFLLETLRLCKKNNIHTALDTSGVGKNYEKLLEYVDLVIWDVKAYKMEDYKRITGRLIGPSLQFLKTCQQMKKKMWIRQVIIPTINDNENYIVGLSQFLKNIKYVEKIELLPYETFAVHKYEKLKIPYKLRGIEPMDKKRCIELEKLLQKVMNGD